MEIDEGDVRPQHYRTRAAEMLKMANEVPDKELKITLLSLASAWEKLAQQAEKMNTALGAWADSAIGAVGNNLPTYKQQ
jgi:hypothetical protein